MYELRFVEIQGRKLRPAGRQASAATCLSPCHENHLSGKLNLFCRFNASRKETSPASPCGPLWGTLREKRIPLLSLFDPILPVKVSHDEMLDTIQKSKALEVTTRSSTWPYIGIAACLFALTLLSSHVWFSGGAVAIEDISRAQPARQEPARPSTPTATPQAPRQDSTSAQAASGQETPPSKSEGKSTGGTPLAVTSNSPGNPNPTSQASAEERRSAASHRGSAASQAPANSVLELTVPSTSPDRDPSVAGIELKPLGTSSDRARLMPLAPPVAERIDVDPSVARRPLLAEPRFDVPYTPFGARRRPGLADSSLAETTVRGDGTTADTAEGGPASRTTTIAKLRSLTWPEATALIEQLQALMSLRQSRDWASRSIEQLQILAGTTSFADGEARSALDRIAHLRNEGMQISYGVRDLNIKSDIQRAVYAMDRRYSLWTRIYNLAVGVSSPARNVELDQIRKSILDVDQHIRTTREYRGWRTFLGLDDLAAECRKTSNLELAARSQLARRILGRMESPLLSDSQQAFLKTEPFTPFRQALRGWVNEPVDYAELLDHLENYEFSGDPEDATQVARAYQILRWSSAASVEEFASELNSHYRNANLRISISEVLLNRLLPKQESMEEPVNDRIAGARIFGRSRTSTDLRVVLIPDQSRWRVGLEAFGEVDSRTSANSGPATFFNQGRSRYQARKMLLIDRRGIHLDAAEADADPQSNLTGMETDFDGLPVINVLARAIARQQYDKSAASSRWQIRRMIANRASERLDEEVDRSLREAGEEFDRRFYQPLASLDLNPVAVDLNTMADRLVVRYRLAGDEQLASHTPRPQAPETALFSLQLNESAINNLLLQLELGKREYTIAELLTKIAHRFERDDYQPPADLPDATILFAENQPVRIECIDDRILLTLNFRELRSGRHVWKNFVVRAYYRPVTEGRNASFVRDGHVMISMQRKKLLNGLRAVFSKVLAQQPEIDLLGDKFRNHEAFQDLQVIQYVARHGWIGMALGVPLR